MAKRQPPAEPASSRRLSMLGKLKAVRPYVLPVLGGTLVTLVTMLAFQKTEYFLLHDERFAMRPAGQGLQVSPDLRITGLSRTPAAAVRRVFRGDEGRSVFLAPLAERRSQLLGIQWVREASVSRVWPNRIDVRVSERIPQAFVRLPARRRGGPSIAALIDADGVILPAPSDPGTYELPVLAGVREDQTPSERAARVKTLRELLHDLGKSAEQVVEVNAAELTNWKLTMEVEDRAVTLSLGNDQFGKKVERFLQHWPEIKRRAPNAYKFDLRLPDRITAVDETPVGSMDPPASIVASAEGVG